MIFHPIYSTFMSFSLLHIAELKHDESALELNFIYKAHSRGILTLQYRHTDWVTACCAIWCMLTLTGQFNVLHKILAIGTSLRVTIKDPDVNN